MCAADELPRVDISMTMPVRMAAIDVCRRRSKGHRRRRDENSCRASQVEARGSGRRRHYCSHARGRRPVADVASRRVPGTVLADNLPPQKARSYTVMTKTDDPAELQRIFTSTRLP